MFWMLLLLKSVEAHSTKKRLQADDATDRWMFRANIYFVL